MRCVFDDIEALNDTFKKYKSNPVLMKLLDWHCGTLVNYGALLQNFSLSSSNAAEGMSEICSDENLWQLLQLE